MKKDFFDDIVVVKRSGQRVSFNDTKVAIAVKKGFEQATKTWGGKLPDICQNTLDTTIEKLEKWRDGINSNEEN